MLATLLNQQRLLVEALDHTGEGSEDESDIHTVFTVLMRQLALTQEYLAKAKGASMIPSQCYFFCHLKDIRPSSFMQRDAIAGRRVWRRWQTNKPSAPRATRAQRRA